MLPISHSHRPSHHLHCLLTVCQGDPRLTQQFLPDIPSSHPCSGSSTGRLEVLSLTLLEGSRGRACGIGCTPAGFTVPPHSSLTHPEQLPAPQAPFRARTPYRCILAQLYFYCTFSVFGRTSAPRCLTAAYGIEHRSRLCRRAARARPQSLGVQEAALTRCV